MRYGTYHIASSEDSDETVQSCQSLNHTGQCKSDRGYYNNLLKAQRYTKYIPVDIYNKFASILLSPDKVRGTKSVCPSDHPYSCIYLCSKLTAIKASCGPFATKNNRVLCLVVWLVFVATINGTKT